MKYRRIVDVYMDHRVKKMKGENPEEETATDIGVEDRDTGTILLPSTHINVIPNEILVKIFGYLDVVRKHRNRRVCRRWRMLLTCHPALRDMLVDQLFYMTDELRTRYIQYTESVSRAITPCLTRLHLSGVAEKKYASFATGREPLLNTVICGMLCCSDSKHYPVTKLTTIRLESGSVGVDDLRHLLARSGRSFRHISFTEVTVKGLCTASVVLSAYSYKVLVNNGEIRLRESPMTEEEVNCAIWSLVEEACPALSLERQAALQSAIDEVQFNNGEDLYQTYFQKIREIVRQRQPHLSSQGIWNGKIAELNGLTQTDLEAYLAPGVLF